MKPTSITVDVGLEFAPNGIRVAATKVLELSSPTSDHDLAQLTQLIESTTTSAISRSKQMGLLDSSDGQQPSSSEPTSGRVDPSSPDTYSIATNTGDRKFLQWITDRLIYMYGEHPNTDFVQIMQKFASTYTPPNPGIRHWHIEEYKFWKGLDKNCWGGSGIVSTKYDELLDTMKYLTRNRPDGIYRIVPVDTA